MASPQPPSRTPPLQQRREEAIQSLSRRFAGDELTLDDFEERLDRVIRAANAAEVDAAVGDLSPSPVGPPDRAPRGAVAPEPPSSGDRQYILAVMSGNTRAGAWTPARKVLSYAFWGGVELDFREAQLPPGTTEVLAIAVMGGVEIIVPPDVGVEVDGFALMGGLEQLHQPPARTGAPRLKITGFALMGGVEVTARYPGESSRDARRRRKSEERERRLERSRDRRLPGG